MPTNVLGKVQGSIWIWQHSIPLSYEWFQGNESSFVPKPALFTKRTVTHVSTLTYSHILFLILAFRSALIPSHLLPKKGFSSSIH